MTLSIEQALRIMKKLGVETVECAHHYRGFVTSEGKRLFPIHCSFGTGELGGGIPHRFRRALQLSVEEFLKLRGCTMSKEEYFDLLRAKGIIQK